MSKFTKVSQLPPLPPPPSMGGVPGSPSAGQPSDKIKGPLNTVEKIIFDFNLKEHASMNAVEIADRIWKEYGGLIGNKADPKKIGTRVQEDEQLSDDIFDKKYRKTETMKWLRLPKGKKITDITNRDELGQIIKKSMFSIVRDLKNNASPSSGGGGMGFLG
jgi:hypothetical protein